MSVWDEKVQQFIQCQICHGTITDPRNLTCGHTFCKICIDDWHKKHNDPQLGTNAASCPNCRKIFILDNDGANGLPVNYHLKDLIEVTKESKDSKKKRNCELCQCDPPKVAISTCIDCKLDMCNECKETHQKFRDASTHYVADISESNERMIVMRKKKSFCTRMSHESHELELYCKECSRPICTKCSLLHHKTHQVEELWVYARENRNILGEILDETKTKRKEYLDGIDSVEKAKDNLQHRKRDAEENIRNLTSKFKQVVQQKETEELEKVESDFEEGMKKLEKKEEELKTDIGIIDSLNTFTDSLRNYGSDANVVLQLEYVCKQSSDMCTHTVQPNVETVNVKFIPNEQVVKLLNDLKMIQLGSEPQDEINGSYYYGSKSHMHDIGPCGGDFNDSSESEEWGEDEFDTEENEYTNGTSAELIPNVSDRPPPLPPRRKKDGSTSDTCTSAASAEEKMSFPQPTDIVLPVLKCVTKRRFDVNMSVTGMTITQRNEVVIVSNENSLINVFSQEGDKLCSMRRKGFENPWDAASGEDGAVYISDTGEKECGIKVLQKKNKAYKIATFMREPDNPHGISFRDRYLYVCDPTAHKIFVYNIDSKRQIQVLDTNNIGSSCPIYISAPINNCIMVSDYREKKVYRINLDTPNIAEPVVSERNLQSPFSPAQTYMCSSEQFFFTDTTSKEIYLFENSSNIARLEFAQFGTKPIALDSRTPGTIWIASRQGVIMLLEYKRS